MAGHLHTHTNRNFGCKANTLFNRCYGNHNVDYETFRITKDDTLGVAGVTLRIMDYKEYVDRVYRPRNYSDVGGSSSICIPYT